MKLQRVLLRRKRVARADRNLSAFKIEYSTRSIASICKLMFSVARAGKESPLSQRLSRSRSIREARRRRNRHATLIPPSLSSHQVLHWHMHWPKLLASCSKVHLCTDDGTKLRATPVIALLDWEIVRRPLHYDGSFTSGISRFAKFAKTVSTNASVAALSRGEVRR